MSTGIAKNEMRILQRIVRGQSFGGQVYQTKTKTHGHREYAAALKLEGEGLVKLVENLPCLRGRKRWVAMPPHCYWDRENFCMAVKVTD